MPRPLSRVLAPTVHPLIMSHYKILRKGRRMHNPWSQNFSATSFLVPFLRKKRNALSWRATESRCGGKEGRLSRLLFASHSLRSYIYYYRQFLFQFSYVSVVPPRRSPDKMSGPPRWLRPLIRRSIK